VGGCLSCTSNATYSVKRREEECAECGAVCEKKFISIINYTGE
jgi:hypothetical protein